MQNAIRQEHDSAVEARCDHRLRTQERLNDQLRSKVWLPVGAEIQEPSNLAPGRGLGGVVVAGRTPRRSSRELQPQGQGRTDWQRAPHVNRAS